MSRSRMERDPVAVRSRLQSWRIRDSSSAIQVRMGSGEFLQVSSARSRAPSGERSNAPSCSNDATDSATERAVRPRSLSSAASSVTTTVWVTGQWCNRAALSGMVRAKVYPTASAWVSSRRASQKSAAVSHEGCHKRPPRSMGRGVVAREPPLGCRPSRLPGIRC